MADSIGTIAIIGMLCLLPCSFICAGNDTDRSFASRIQRQREAIMDWTNKQILVSEDRFPTKDVKLENAELPEPKKKMLINT